MLLAALGWLGLLLASGPALARLAPPAHRASQRRGVEILHLVGKGESLFGILTGLGVPRGEVLRWRQAGRGIYDLRRISPGRRMRLFFDTSARLERLEYEISGGEVISLRRAGERIHARKLSIPVEVSLKAVTATVNSSVYGAATKVGVPDRVISELADIFAWQIDFSSDIQKGDTLRIIYEQIERPGEEPQAGKILAAEITSGGAIFSAFYYRDKEGNGGYFDQTGKALGRSFLRYPLAFTRISSPFARVRRHPVLKLRRPHLGVDLAAPRGTPVRVVADGRVTARCWKGGYGRTVRVSHGRGYATLYAHLQRYAPGLRRGQKVRKGQVIGYVGSSGLATGPHLHFAMFINGRYVNPLKARVPARQSLRGGELIAFLRKSGPLRQRLAALGGSDRPAQVTLFRPAGSLLLDTPRSPLASSLY